MRPGLIACLNRSSFYNRSLTPFCRLLSQADLASIHSSEENQFVTDLSDGRRFWLGGQLGWSWSDGTPWNYQNWLSGEPNGNGAEGCLENVALVTGEENKGKWNDRACDNTGGDVCMICVKELNSCYWQFSF